MAKTTLRNYLQNTEDAISSGRIDEALANCQYILTHFPESLEAQRLLGEVYLAQGQLQEAQQTFDWVLTNDPENVIAYCDRALISESMEDLDTALDCYQQAYELSRGNSQIRQEFNQLSARAGQQGFMFSRAGLARLYIRGDLLPQAIQEWEVVLAATPDRLDARTGLLEAFWREGNYDKVEQLARQILDDVPGCVKALLLLAHISSMQNIHQAQELIQQVRALDPELIMANDLFSDLMASQPHDPFLALLKKEPIVFPETTNGNGHTSHTEERVFTQVKRTAFPDSLVTWSGMDSLVDPPQDQAMQESAARSSWSGNSTLDVDPWATLGQQDYQPKKEAPQTSTQPRSGTPEDDPRSTFHEGAGATSETRHSPPASTNEPAIAHDQAPPEQHPWYQFDEPSLETNDPWSSLSNMAPTRPADSLRQEGDEKDLASPPSWLDMLTKGEPRQKSEAMQKLPPSKPTPPEPPPAGPPVQQPSEPVFNTEPPGNQQLPAVSAEQDDESPFFFGPEWLKSLGATSMERSLPSEPAAAPAPAAPVPPVVPEPVQQVPAQPGIDMVAEPPVEPQVEQAPTPSTPIWEEQAAYQPIPSWADQVANPPAPSWIDQITNTPAQPMANQVPDPIAEHEQQYLTTLEHLEQSLRSQGFAPLEPGALSTLVRGQEPPPSSVLAELSSLVPQPSHVSNPAPLSEPATTSNVPPAEPLWSAAPNPVPGQVSTPTPVANVSSAPSAPTRAEALRENELETTMRRPAVRLQPVQQPPTRTAQPDSATLIGKGRPTVDKTPESTISYQDRLLRGYQHQLAGAYDEAMQEYRIIIRNAPELLSEVVSNLRALLKLAPRYSAGYRVLGDAYMRQGEYLQAMEAYNKALTMAKKARG